MIHQVLADQPSISVIAAAGAGADDQGQFLALVEIVRPRSRGAQNGAERRRRHAGRYRVSPHRKSHIILPE
jgi:hypothetical protein